MKNYARDVLRLADQVEGIDMVFRSSVGRSLRALAAELAADMERERDVKRELAKLRLYSFARRAQAEQNKELHTRLMASALEVERRVQRSRRLRGTT